MLEVIGFLVVTGFLLYLTYAVYGIAWVVTGLGGEPLQGVAFALVGSVPVVVGWWLWWEHIGSKINVSFG